MGLCPSRNRSIATGKAQKESIISTPPGLDPPTPPTNFKLRADADEFVPQPADLPTVTVDKEPWEKFLDLKQKEVTTGVRNNNSNFVRKVDGTFTADYRRLLETEKPGPRRYVPPQQRGALGKTDDLIREWKETDFKPKKGYGTTYAEKKPEQKKKPVGSKDSASTRFEEADAKLRAALTKVKSGLAAKDAMKDLEALEAMESKQAKDDSEVCKGQLVPFGLTDYHYFSDTQDSSKSQSHVGKIVRKPKDYAKNQKITPELEEAMTEVLFRLRGLRNVETGTDMEKSRRYCVGIREVGRALKDASNCPLKAVLVAPDVEQGGRTVRGSLDEKLGNLLSTCKDLKIPVVYGLSRVRLGQAIKKSVTISVMGILDVRGMQEPFETMLTLAT